MIGEIAAARLPWHEECAPRTIGADGPGHALDVGEHASDDVRASGRAGAAQEPAPPLSPPPPPLPPPPSPLPPPPPLPPPLPPPPPSPPSPSPSSPSSPPSPPPSPPSPPSPQPSLWRLFGGGRPKGQQNQQHPGGGRPKGQRNQQHPSFGRRNWPPIRTERTPDRGIRWRHFLQVVDRFIDAEQKETVPVKDKNANLTAGPQADGTVVRETSFIESPLDASYIEATSKPGKRGRRQQGAGSSFFGIFPDKILNCPKGVKNAVHRFSLLTVRSYTNPYTLDAAGRGGGGAQNLRSLISYWRAETVFNGKSWEEA